MGLYSHDVGHHCDVIWELDDYHDPINGYALGKASTPNIHYKPCTTIDECHPWCLEQQGQHHGVALVFVRWVTNLKCPLTMIFAHCHQDVDFGLNCLVINCRNLSLRLASKARAYKNAGQKGSPGGTSYTPMSVRECERMNLHTPK